MSKNVDLTSKEWCDLVFEGKNKAFGGYLLRVNSPKRYTWATIGVICVVAFAFVLPYIVESFKFGEVEEETTVVVEMTQLPEAEVEKQEVQPLVETPPPPPLKSSIKFTAPVIKKDEEVSDEEELKSQDELTQSKVNISIADVKGNDEEHGQDIADFREVIAEPVVDEKRGNHQMLEKYAAKYGYTVDVVEKAYYKDREISSTYIRELLLDGNVPLANELLGYPYEITSVVEHGQQLGRTLGFPTMNLAPQEKKILPKYGVYACRVLVDGVWYGGVGNAGVKPTVAQEKRRLFEVYVYGYEGDAYGKTATVQILEFERPETKFHSVEELKDRVMKDMRYGEEYLKNHPFDER